MWQSVAGVLSEPSPPRKESMAVPATPGHLTSSWSALWRRGRSTTLFHDSLMKRDLMEVTCGTRESVSLFFE